MVSKIGLGFSVKCDKPRYSVGEWRFGTYVEVFEWLETVRCLSKAAPSHWLYALVKSGHLSMSNANYQIKIISEFKDYDLARDVAFDTGLLKGGPGDIYNPSREAALAFAREMDRRALQSTHDQTR